VRVAVAPVADTACVAPIGTALANVYVSALVRPSVTTDPPDAPPLTTPHEADAGKLYIALDATVTDAFVRVETNVNVNVVAAVVAVTVAPSTLLAASVAPGVAVIVGVVESVTSALVVAPDANAPSAELIVDTEWLNVNCVAVAYDATRAYVSPPAIVAIVTVSGTANAVWPLVAMTFAAPDGAVTVTRNSSAPVVMPSVIDVTAILFVALSYVYDATAPVTRVPPTYRSTAPVAATAVVFGVSASMFPSVSMTVEVVEVADPYARPAANPRTL
jgi:hypothetical protein